MTDTSTMHTNWGCKNRKWISLKIHNLNLNYTWCTEKHTRKQDTQWQRKRDQFDVNHFLYSSMWIIQRRCEKRLNFEKMKNVTSILNCFKAILFVRVFFFLCDIFCGFLLFFFILSTFPLGLTSWPYMHDYCEIFE